MMARGSGRKGLSGALHDGPDGPHTVDVHVGARIRLRRTLKGLSQTALGAAVGLTFQQSQKYEKGGNRVSASRLWQLAQVLDVRVSFFFDDLPTAFPGGPEQIRMAPLAVEPESGAAMTKRETLELVRAYYGVRDEAVRRRLYDIVKALAVADPEAGAGRG